MAKSFTDKFGETIIIDKYEMDIQVETHEDVVTDEITGYVVRVNDNPYEVTEEVYEAVKQYANL